MLHVHHAFGDPELGARFAQDELRSEDLIVLRNRHEGGMADEAIEHRVVTGGPEWSVVRLVIDGELLVRDGPASIVLSPGEAYASRAWGTAPARFLTSSTEMLLFAWRANGRMGPALASDGLLRFEPRASAALLRLSQAMSKPSTLTAELALLDAAAALRASGAPLAEDLPVLTAPRASHEFAQALERVLFPMTSQPMAIDLARALGVGERQALRRANDHFRRFHLSVCTWREYVHAMRLGLSSFFMSQARASTEHVSRLVGFTSPTSFCHALHEAGLPSPMALQRELRAT